MGCGCNKTTSNQKFEWTASDGSAKILYPNKIQAQAKVLRSGGSIKPVAG